MTTITLKAIERTYKNNGQHAEQVFRFTMTGELTKADNKPCTECGDLDDIQIKSARATICKGTDIASHLEQDAANRYAYVVADATIAYLMDKTEYLEFANLFGTVTRESKANGGAEKMRFKAEGKAMIEWLGARA